MARGVRRHLKRLNAPSSWQLDKLGGIFATRVRASGHKFAECIPLSLVLRNRMHLAKDLRETKLIVNSKNILVDGKIRTDYSFPLGFMDTLEIKKLDKTFRCLYDVKGRLTLVPIDKKEAEFKLLRINAIYNGEYGVRYGTAHDGRTIRFLADDVKVNDTIKFDLKSGNVIEKAQFNMGQLAYVTVGASVGAVGKITQVDKHAGSYSMVHLVDAVGQKFITRIENVFVVGNNGNSFVTLPKDKGIKPTVFQDREARLASIAKQKKE